MRFHLSHPVMFIGGRKGGVGKSFFARVLEASVLTDRVDRLSSAPRDGKESERPKAGSRRARSKHGRKRG